MVFTVLWLQFVRRPKKRGAVLARRRSEEIGRAWETGQVCWSSCGFAPRPAAAHLSTAADAAASSITAATDTTYGVTADVDVLQIVTDDGSTDDVHVDASVVELGAALPLKL